MNKIWHIIILKPAPNMTVRTFRVHKALTDMMGEGNPLNGCEVWTPFSVKHKPVTRTQRKQGVSVNRKRIAIFGIFGYMYIGMPRDGYSEAATALKYAVDDHRFISGMALDRIEQGVKSRWYQVPDMARVMEGHKKSYDPAKDSDKVNDTDERDRIDIPEFTQGEVVRFISGPMQGIDFEVWSTLEGAVKMRAKEVGFINKVEASAFDVERVA